jgi:hypothetical protein
MPNRLSPTGSELFIIINSNTDWKVLRYLHDWCQISKAIDIATDYFEIGSFPSLGNEWQKVDKIRIHEGRVPDFRAIRDNDLEQIDEAKRLLYVSITRARRFLMYVTDEEHYKNRPNRFILKEHLDLPRYDALF